MNAPKPSACRLAPWRKQMQRIFTILIIVFALASVMLVYLSISEKMTDANLKIQELQAERSEYSEKIADLTTDEGILTAYKALLSRAQEMGFSEINFYDENQYEYVVVNGYTGTGIHTKETVPERPETEVVSLIKPEYTESLQDWLVKQISTGIESYEITN